MIGFNPLTLRFHSDCHPWSCIHPIISYQSSCHLDELVDVGLVDRRQRRTADSQGFFTYYRPTAMGRGILEHGVEELLGREREFDDAYS